MNIAFHEIDDFMRINGHTCNDLKVHLYHALLEISKVILSALRLLILLFL